MSRRRTRGKIKELHPDISQQDVEQALKSRGMLGRTDVYRFIRWVNRICKEFGMLTEEQIEAMPFPNKHEIWLRYIDSYNRAQSHQRRVALSSSTTQFNEAGIARLWKNGEGRCAYCSEILTSPFYHIDHIVPLSRGGSNGPENIAIACEFCNLSKGGKTLEEWTPRWYDSRNKY